VSKDLFASATYNNPELTKRLVAVWRKSLGDDNVKIVDPTMGGEDFSEYSLPDHSIPAVIFTSEQSSQRRSRSTNRREKNCQPCIRVNSRLFPSRPFASATSE